MLTEEQIQERLAEDEWNWLIRNYPHVAFNIRSFQGKWQTPENGYRCLVQCEPYVGMKENWEWERLLQYDKVVTFSPEFYHQHSSILNMELVQGCIGCNAYFDLQDPIPVENKIPGMCVLNKLVDSGGVEGDVYWLRPEILNNLHPWIERHVWCTQEWGGSYYRGAVEAPFHHSHINHLRKINEYRFCLCFESTFNPLWSSGFVTERILNCFRARTVPIYLGCWNIEDYIPKKFFIDFREYWPGPHCKRYYDDLSRRMIEMSKEEYVDMIEGAYQWVKDCRLGNVEDLEKHLVEYRQ